MGNCQLKESIFRAVQAGDVAATSALLAKLGPGADLSFAQAPQGLTPLHVACLCGHADVAELLLKHGAPVDARDAEGRTSLHLSALGGQKEIVAMLLSFDARVDAVSAKGLTPFLLASWRGHSALAHSLLAQGADLLAADTEGRTAWMLAREWSHVAFADELEQLALQRGWKAPPPAAAAEQQQIAIDMSGAASESPHPAAVKQVVAEQAPHAHSTLSVEVPAA